MTTDLVFVATMPRLRVVAQRCRRLALTVRSDAAREKLLALATEMERQAAANDRALAAETHRQAG